MKKIVIVGKGGLAREVKWLIDNINQVSRQWDFVGYIDKETGAEQVVGNDNYVIDAKQELSVAIAIGNPQIRKCIYEKYKKNIYIHFPNLVAPTACVSQNLTWGEGNIICANTVMTVDISIGNFNIINYGCTVGHDVKMGSFNTVNPGSNIAGNVKMDDLIEIGTGSRIIQEKTINKGAVIGAGAVVIRDVSCDTTVVGVPAAAIRKKE